jgi:hypothetical protein
VQALLLGLLLMMQQSNAMKRDLIPLSKIDRELGLMRASGALCEIRLHSSTAIFCNNP